MTTPSGLTCKISSHKGRILRHLSANQDTWFLSSEFSGANSSCPFIGYEAPTVLGILQKAGFVVSRWCEEMLQRGERRKEYRLADRVIVSENDELTLTAVKTEAEEPSVQLELPDF